MKAYVDQAARTVEYRPAGMLMWDTWGLEHAEELHLFHLQRLAPGSDRPAVEQDWVGHCVSRDLLRWREEPPALGPNLPGTDDDLQNWTGCALEHAGQFYLYYTMRSSANGASRQKIGLATSRDLQTWTRHPGNPLIEPDPRWYVGKDQPLPPPVRNNAAQKPNSGVVDCRDLLVVRHPAGGWLGFYAARIPAAEPPQQAVIAAVRSDDLVKWTHLPPAFAPAKYNCIEVPDVFEIDGRWYLTCLTGSQYGNRGGFSDRYATRATIYAVADRPEGPYREIDGDNVLICGDRSCGFSCRSFIFQGHRRVIYVQEAAPQTITLSPPLRVTTAAGGRLRLAYDPAVQGWRAQPLIAADSPRPLAGLPCNHEQWNVRGGDWQLNHGRYAGRSASSYQVASLGAGAPSVEFEAVVTIAAGAAGGLVLRADHRAEVSRRDLIVMLDAEEGCLLVGRPPEFDDCQRRQFAVQRARAYHVRICQRRLRLEVFIDHHLMIQMVLKETERPAPGLGIVVDRGQVTVEQLAAWRLEE